MTPDTQEGTAPVFNLQATSFNVAARTVAGRIEDNQLLLEVGATGSLVSSRWSLYQPRPHEYRVTPRALDSLDPAQQRAQALVAALWLFVNDVDVASLEFVIPAGSALRRTLLEIGFGIPSAEADLLYCRRSSLFQLSEVWLSASSSNGYPFEYVVTQGKRHPRRPPRPEGVCYRRYISALGATVSFRTASAERDLPHFSRWMNDPRVAAFWELQGESERHREYLSQTLADPHVHPVIGCFDDQPFGYFELYWAKEDRIAPYYEVDDYDRGVHMLVGEPSHRGPAKVNAWLPSLAHYLFLDDTRTRNVVAEPRADNTKMIGYLQRAGFYKSKEFDFPHKRAAMMVLSREAFFDQFCP
jgi:RimJ/RimL family protein N-acetyltransferase